MNLGFVLMGVPAAMYSLFIGFLFVMAFLLSPLISLADGIVFHRLAYKKSKTKCFLDSLKLNLLMLVAIYLWGLFIEAEYRFASHYCKTIPLALQLFLVFLSMLLPVLLLWWFAFLENRLIQFMNPAFPVALIRKSMLIRYRLKAGYLVLFLLVIFWLDS